MLSILCVGLTITVKVGIPESFKVGWYPTKKTGSSHLMPFTQGNLKVIRLRFFNGNFNFYTLLLKIGLTFSKESFSKWLFKSKTYSVL